MSLSIIRQVQVQVKNQHPNSNQWKNLLCRAVGGIFQSSNWSPISVSQPQPQPQPQLLLPQQPQQHETPLPSVYHQLYGMNGKLGSGSGSSSVLQMDVHGGITSIGDDTSSSGILEDLSTWLISTLKRRKKKMNKHKLQKRRKKLRLKTKK